MADGGDDDKEGSLQWLRDHGVTVETPADRLAAKKAAADLVKLKAGDPNTRCCGGFPRGLVFSFFNYLWFIYIVRLSMYEFLFRKFCCGTAEVECVHTG